VGAEYDRARRQLESDPAQAAFNVYGQLRGQVPGAADAPMEEYIAPDFESQLAGAAADPRDIAAQREALEGLQVWGRGEETAIDRARREQAQREARGYERGQRGAIMQQAEMRGMGGSGSALAAQLQAQQSGANRLSFESLANEAMIQQRALESLQAAGSMAGDMRTRGMAEEMTRRGAIDEFNRYNLDERRAVQQRNVGAQRDERQQEFANRFNIAAGQTGQTGTLIQAKHDAEQREREREQAMWGNIIRAGASLGGAALGAL
jgi:hypothetical protein